MVAGRFKIAVNEGRDWVLVAMGHGHGHFVLVSSSLFKSDDQILVYRTSSTRAVATAFVNRRMTQSDASDEALALSVMVEDVVLGPRKFKAKTVSLLTDALKEVEVSAIDSLRSFGEDSVGPGEVRGWRRSGL